MVDRVSEFKGCLIKFRAIASFGVEGVVPEIREFLELLQAIAELVGPSLNSNVSTFSLGWIVAMGMLGDISLKLQS